MAPRIYTDEQKAHMALVEANVREGDLLTYTVCMGHVREAFYTGRDGYWLCGKPTPDTRKLEGWQGPDWRGYTVDDISPLHVTHINRDEVAAIPILLEIDATWKARA